MKKRHGVAGLAAMTGIVLLTGWAVSPAEGNENAARTVPEIEWGECDPERMDLNKDNVECGFIKLPIDWEDQAGETFKSRVYRQKADGPSKGTFINFPSGPGSTADIGFASIAEIAPGFDRIGIDPRGVSGTSAIQCDPRAVLRLPLIPPVEESAFATFVKEGKFLADSCSTQPRALQSHLDAYSNARDVDALRRALGVEKVGVYGFSYGTLLGARYVELFGKNVTSTVLEGVLNPQQTGVEFQAVAARGSQLLFTAFVEWCSISDECSPLDKDPRGALSRAVKNVENGKIPGKTLMGRSWEPAAVVQTVELAISTGDFAAGVGPLVALANGEAPPEPDDERPDASSDEIPSRFTYPDRIVCADYDLGVRTIEEARVIRNRIVQVAPDVKVSPNSSAYMGACATSAKPTMAHNSPFRNTSPNPVMLVSNTLDPATPREWADQVMSLLGRQSRHLVADRVGHGGATEDPKILAAIKDYVVETSPKG